jgi:hypothetical protein
MSAPRILVRAAGLALAGALSLTSVASAGSVPSSITVTGTGMTLTLSNVTLQTKAAVSVDVDFVCDPLDEFGTPVSALIVDQASVTISEAVGKSIARGTGEFSGPVTCDSTTVNHFAVLAISTTVPFKAGSGVIQSTVFAFDFNFCCSGDWFRRATIQGVIKIGR